ncbi:FAD-dependent oxidoreductase [Marinospirillum alkaliphilum]|uniref:Predicted NAD/FAD-binding protein n=1 Tax=Marinospirillum alkaliphilum DSM 21637 TaxID=1122209 RepID=A0A1K1UAD6_9GAMM|nr:FAD-dependent oxidoreductase [Marinospirillum alkaliphilum]SFX09782.1 Predicted NAD/FAD-binding protein [Marinospirillum alkaliphilum DSM 21637]
MTYSIAVIGSGMAGLAAAYRARCTGHDVTVFEALDSHGMDAHAMTFNGGLVDVPLRVMSPDDWPGVLQLAKGVGVGTFSVRTYTSCSWINRQTWFRSGEIPILGWPFVGSWRYLNIRALRMGWGIWQLKRLTRKLEQQGTELTLGEILEQHRFDPLFWRGLVLPILTTICTCEEKHLLNWPAAQLLSLLRGILHGSELYRLEGGTSALVKGLSENLKLYSGSPVAQVEENNEGVKVYNQRGDGGVFDRVIVATQANQLDFLDNTQFAEEQKMLANIRFDSGELWVHQDQRFMPAKKQDWTALNFQMDEALKKPMFTVWVNQVEPTLKGCAPVFQTWNPLYEPAPDTVLARIPLERAVVHPGTAQVHEALNQWHDQPGRKVFFCGSWAYEGVPLLESAVRSANAAVDAINCEGVNGLQL